MTRQNLNSLFAGLVSAGIVVSMGVNTPASADPLPGEVLKFSQLPLGGGPVPPPVPGTDILSDAVSTSAPNLYSGTFAADDFSDNVSQPIVHVQWWGSYIPNPNGTAPTNPVQDFVIAFESDNPISTANTFSTPATVLSSQIVTPRALLPGSGTFTETLQGGIASEPLYRYNAELRVPFPEQANTVYWLKILALTTPTDNIQWGWHNRDYTVQDTLASAAPSPGEVNLGSAVNPIWHFQDDAVGGNVIYDASQNLLQQSGDTPLNYNNTTDGFPAGAITASEDLAFNLYYANVPEPVALPLLAAGMMLLRRQRRVA